MKKTILLLLFLPLALFAQHKKADSLLTVIKKDKDDTNKVLHLDDLINQYRSGSDFDTALYFTNLQLQLAEKLKFKKGISLAYYNFGTLYRYKGSYPLALKNANIALNIQKETGNKKAQAVTYNEIGIIYRLQGNFAEALNNLFSSLKIKEELKDKRGLASAYNNIGNIYLQQQDYEAALTNFRIALKINQELDNKSWMAINYSNIGSVYYELKNFPEALKNDSAALKLDLETKNKSALADAYINFGILFGEENKYDEAVANYNLALKLREEIGDKPGIVSCYINLGNDMISAHKNKLADNYLQKALQLSLELGNKAKLRKIYRCFVKLDSAVGNYKAAYSDYKMFILYRDSLFNEESTKKTVQAQMNYEFYKKTAADSVKNVEQIKLKDVEAQAKLDQEKTKQYVLYGGVVLLLIFGGFMFNRFLVTQKQKRIIEIKSRETEQQKDIIEEKQKEIVDSINYAKRIQYALLAHEKLLWANLNHHFVLFKPKDIVSGDFYWATKVERTSPNGERISKFFLACCDSTGHGVPGAFMSLLNISFLNEAIIEKNILEPNEVLNHVRKRLIENISQDGGQDGMDAILICIDRTKNTITYSAAHNSPLLIHNGETKNLSFDKMPIGKGEKMDPFTLHTIEAQKGDSIYLFTDGYADQFGGPKGKKFKYKQFEELLLSISKEPLKQQSEILNSTFENWRGNLEQIDDVLVIGIRI